MAAHRRAFEREAESLSIEIVTGGEADHVHVRSPEHGEMRVRVEDGVAIVSEPVPEWARRPLAQVGVQGYEVRE